MRMRDRMSENMSKEVSLSAGYSTKVIFSEGVKNNQRQSQWRRAGPCAQAHTIAFSNNTIMVMISSIWTWILLLYLCFFALWLWFLHPHMPTTRQPYAQKHLHRAAFTRLYSYTERFVRRKTLVGSTQRRKFCWYRCFVQRCFCTQMKTHKHFCTALWRQRSLCTEKSLYIDFAREKK